MLPACLQRVPATVVFAAAVLFAACSSPQRPPGEPATTTPSTAETGPEDRHPDADLPPGEQPGDDAPAGDTMSSEAGPRPAREPAAAAVVARLARQLHVPPEGITVAQVARADWPNACLGLPAEGEICADIITPGYAVSLIVAGQRYEFRTDASGRRIRLAFAPLEEIGEVLLSWRDSASFSVLQVGTERLAFGLRGRPLLVVPPPTPERARQLVTFISEYTALYARTPAGEVTLRGVGSREALPVERRRIAEWARLVFSEIAYGVDQATGDRALVWRREGGSAGSCDELVVSRTGFATAWSCRESPARRVASVRLTASELEQLYRWLDQFEAAAWKQGVDPATADALTVSISLEGQGSQSLPDDEREAVLAFVHALVRRVLTDGSDA